MATAALPPKNRRNGPSRAMGWSLGLAEREADAIHDRLMQGLPYRSVESLLAASGLRQHELLAAAQLPASTLSRRKAAAQLDPAESERLFRVAQVFERTLQLFEGDAAGARRWLTEPVRGLGQRRPLELARTQVGAQLVLDLIGRLERGVFS
ncbi:MAG TPA: antitoxin Xre/MbcA/ParS toxin-binding domain-containing protein [Gemmataceae bacterium]|jgi:putative toxin-antitoxin system antitoxin component (TIGR02293 family)